MDSPTDAPNVSFHPHAAAFLDSQPVTIQGDVIAIASWLYGSPAVDGVTKFWIPGPRLFGVRQYRRAYVDEKYSIVYEFDQEADPPLLTVIEIVLA